MTQTSKSSLLWCIRLIAATLTLVIAYRSYKAEGFLGLMGVLFSVGLGLLLHFPNQQGTKLATENMMRYGLEPDRDEAPPSA